jgi:hypothetical protein
LCRLIACSMPIRANIVGPFVSATKIRGLNGGLPCRMVLLGLRQLRDVVRRILERQKRLSLRDRNRIIEVGGSGH